MRRLVESYGTDEPIAESGTLPGWYVRAVRQAYRATVLDIVHKYDAYDIQALIPLIENAGGVVTNWEGGSCDRGGEVLACGDRALHAELLHRIAR